MEEQGRQLKWSLAPSIGAGARKSVLATEPVAVPSSMIELRWGGSRAVHVLNAIARSPASPPSPAYAADDPGGDVDDASRANDTSSAAKRKRVVSSDDSSQDWENLQDPRDKLSSEAAAPRGKLDTVSAALSVAKEAIATIGAAANLEHAAAAPAAARADGSGGAPPQQQQAHSQPRPRRQSVGSSDIVVLLDD